MPSLKVKCTSCGAITNTGMSMDQASFSSSTLSNNSTRCASCGNTVTWNKEDVLDISFS